MRIFLISIIALALSSCSSAPFSPAPWAVGEVRKSGIGTYKKLIHEESGWRVWETASTGSVTCVAVKPSKGKGWPRISDGHGIVVGGAGFYMHVNELLMEPYFGFYGSQVYRRSSVAEVEGKIVSWTNKKDTVLSWERKSINFEVRSGPYRKLYVDVRKDSGVIDFTGIKKSFSVMNKCISSTQRKA